MDNKGQIISALKEWLAHVSEQESLGIVQHVRLYTAVAFLARLGNPVSVEPRFRQVMLEGSVSCMKGQLQSALLASEAYVDGCELDEISKSLGFEVIQFVGMHIMIQWLHENNMLGDCPLLEMCEHLGQVLKGCSFLWAQHFQAQQTLEGSDFWAFSYLRDWVPWWFKRYLPAEVPETTN
jgi:hypothetical protein